MVTINHWLLEEFGSAAFRSKVALFDCFEKKIVFCCDRNFEQDACSVQGYFIQNNSEMICL